MAAGDARIQVRRRDRLLSGEFPSESQLVERELKRVTRLAAAHLDALGEQD